MSRTATAQSSAAAQEQGTHHYVLTLQKPVPNSASYVVATSSGTCSPTGMSRQDVYTWLVGEMVRRTPQLAGASTVFFDLRPNQI
ncbi:hypothetical protein ACIQF6_33955 [Kitasatospora sp. NPDC092948]|uniref:hypothetical protein n=1 Tax=Kitasatospora sp. NPDC092948 TaxID=3364088 RepID=UPI0038180424